VGGHTTIFLFFYFAVRVPTQRRRISRKPVGQTDRHWATGFSLSLSLYFCDYKTRTHTKRNNLRDRDREIGTEQFRAFPKAVERRDDGAREDVFKNLKIKTRKKQKNKKNQHLFQCLEKLFVFYLIDVLYVKVGETGRVAQVLQPPRSVICQRKIPNKKLSTFDLNKKMKRKKSS